MEYLLYCFYIIYNIITFVILYNNIFKEYDFHKRRINKKITLHMDNLFTSSVRLERLSEKGGKRRDT